MPAAPAAMTKIIALVAKPNPRTRAIRRMMILSPLDPRSRGLSARAEMNYATRPADGRCRAGALRRPVVRGFCVDSLTCRSHAAGNRRRYNPILGGSPQPSRALFIDCPGRRLECGRRGCGLQSLVGAEIIPTDGEKGVDRRGEPGRGRITPLRRDQRNGVLRIREIAKLDQHGGHI